MSKNLIEKLTKIQSENDDLKAFKKSVTKYLQKAQDFLPQKEPQGAYKTLEEAYKTLEDAAERLMLYHSLPFAAFPYTGPESFAKFVDEYIAGLL